MIDTKIRKLSKDSHECLLSILIYQFMLKKLYSIAEELAMVGQ